MAGSGVLMVFSFDGGGCYGFGRKDLERRSGIRRMKTLLFTQLKARVRKVKRREG